MGVATPLVVGFAVGIAARVRTVPRAAAAIAEVQTEIHTLGAEQRTREEAVADAIVPPIHGHLNVQRDQRFVRKHRVQTRHLGRGQADSSQHDFAHASLGVRNIRLHRCTLHALFRAHVVCTQFVRCWHHNVGFCRNDKTIVCG